MISDINETNNNIYISIDSPYIESREDLISFVDDVKATVGGRFSGTGRGGSWTAWDLISENNISLKVGLVSSMDEKYVKPGTEIFIKIYI